MQNSMDDIFVRFVTKDIDEEKIDRLDTLKSHLSYCQDAPEGMNFYGFEEWRDNLKERIAALESEVNKFIKILPMKEFLALSPESLPNEVRNLQKTLLLIYKENEKSPIYHKFPKRDIPLLIDYSRLLNEEVDGSYSAWNNKITLNSDILNSEKLLETLAHELKHAEQWFDTDKINLNSYQEQQLGVLAEAQAYACGQYVHKRCFNEILNEKKAFNPMVSLVNNLFGDKMRHIFEGCMQSQYMINHLEDFFDLHSYYSSYKEMFETSYPILKGDKGLTDIPDSFGIEKKDRVKILKFLNENVSKKARTPIGIFLEACMNKDVQRLNALMRAKRTTGEYFFPDDDFKSISGTLAFEVKMIFDAVQNSGRLTKKDYIKGFYQVMHLKDNVEYEQKDIEERLEIFKALILLKDEKGRFIIPRKMIEEDFEMKMINSENPITQKLIKKANECLKECRPVGKKKMRADNQNC